MSTSNRRRRTQIVQSSDPAVLLANLKNGVSTSESVDPIVEEPTVITTVTEEEIVSDTKNEPVVLALPPWVRALSPAKIFSAQNIIMLLLVGLAVYAVYTFKNAEQDGTVIDDGAVVVSAFDFGDLEEDKQDLVIKYVSEFLKYQEKDYKSKAKILASYGDQEFESDEARLAWFNDQFLKAQTKDMTTLKASMADIVEADVVDVTGEYMAEAIKKKRR